MNSTADNLADPGAAATALPLSVDGKVISERQRFYVLILLALTYTLNTADRGILRILIPPIKAEFDLLDWQVGLLMGPIFALVYAICSLPLAALSDRTSRRNLISATMLVFSGATALCGLASSYVHLAAGRFLTGSAESATVPAASAMIADLYPPARRTSAIAIFTAGGSVGGTIAGMVGGVVAHHYGWREAFFVAGIPGVLLALTIMLTVKEPQRIVARIQGVKIPPVPMIAVVKQILAQPAFCWLMAGNTLLFFKNGGFGSFEAVFLVQTHHLNIQQIGTVETIIGMGGLLVTLLVGKVVDKLSQRDMRWFMYTAVIVSLLGIPFALVLLLATNPWVALIVGSMSALFALSYAAPLFAAAQILVPNAMRARAIAILLLSTTLLGAGLGPPVAGLISDHLAATLGKAEGLRWSMMIMLIPGLFATFSFWRASVTLRRDAARVIGAA